MLDDITRSKVDRWLLFRSSIISGSMVSSCSVPHSDKVAATVPATTSVFKAERTTKLPKSLLIPYTHLGELWHSQRWVTKLHLTGKTVEIVSDWLIRHSLQGFLQFLEAIALLLGLLFEVAHSHFYSSSVLTGTVLSSRSTWDCLEPIPLPMGWNPRGLCKWMWELWKSWQH